MQSTGDLIWSQAYHRPCLPRFWLWWWGSAFPDGPRWAGTGWRWSSLLPHTKSRRWSSRGTVAPAHLCRSGGCCCAPQDGRCSPNRTGRWSEPSRRQNLQGGGKKKTACQLNWSAPISDCCETLLHEGKLNIKVAHMVIRYEETDL